MKKIISIIMAIAVVFTVSVSLTSCGKSDDTSNPATSVSTSDKTDDVNTVGQGAYDFNLKVTDLNGKSASFLVKTDKKTVGEALLELNLIAGDEGPYGLYVKTVNGITADYDTDGSYWAFYINGEYALTGVDSTNITSGADYEFKIEVVEAEK